MSKAIIGSLVMYFPNENDNISRPRNEGVPAIVIGTGSKELPTLKGNDDNDKGNLIVLETKKVSTAKLLVLQDNPSGSAFLSREVVHEDDSESEKMNYKLNFWKELKNDSLDTLKEIEESFKSLSDSVIELKDLKGTVSTLQSTVSSLQSNVSELTTKVNALNTPRL